MDVLLGLPCTVVDPVDTAPARAVGALPYQGDQPRSDIAAAHVVHCTQRRGWPVVTGDPEPLLTLDHSIEIEVLPESPRAEAAPRTAETRVILIGNTT